MEINGQQIQEVYYYKDMGLSEATRKALDKKGFTQATPIQGGAIPYFMEWKDVVAKAPTGTGKTFAFGIPMVEHIDPDSDAVQGLILAPTRELAIQIRDELRDLCAFRRGCGRCASTGASPLTSRSPSSRPSPRSWWPPPGGSWTT